MNPLNPSKVVISWDVLISCISHSLSTEHQEVMGLLLGYHNQKDNDTVQVVVTRSMVLSRKDKKKDRVEVGYEHLAHASTVAERLAEIDKSPISVIGWYHSHPHITVLPSHVDVRTQGSYQQLDRGFVGLILSVFDKGRIEICAFQSNGIGESPTCCEWSRLEIPISISDSSTDQFNTKMLDTMIALELVLLNEERITFRKEFFANSFLGISRTSTVYHNSLLRMIDLQLSPLLMSLESRIRSLELERKYLIDSEPNVMNRKRNLNQMDTAATAEYDSSNIKHDLQKSGSVSGLIAFESAVPDWCRSTQALDYVFKGFAMNISFCDSFIRDVTNKHHPSLVNGLHVLRFVSTNDKLFQESNDSRRRISLWDILLDDHFHFLIVDITRDEISDSIILQIQSLEFTGTVENITLVESHSEISKQIYEITLRQDDNYIDFNMYKLLKDELKSALFLHL